MRSLIYIRNRSGENASHSLRAIFAQSFTAHAKKAIFPLSVKFLTENLKLSWSDSYSTTKFGGNDVKFGNNRLRGTKLEFSIVSYELIVAYNTVARLCYRDETDYNSPLNADSLCALSYFHNAVFLIA